VSLTPDLQAAAGLLAAHPATTDALSRAMGLAVEWTASPELRGPGPSVIGREPGEWAAIRALLDAYPGPVEATASRLGTGPRPDP
jgi:hypothetical protein